MFRSFRFFSLFVPVVFMLVSVGCATAPQQSTPNLRQGGEVSAMVAKYPKGYQDWVCTTSKVVLNKKRSDYGFQRVFVSNKAMDAYKNIGPYPKGAKLVLEFNEPLLEGSEGDIVKGPVNWIAVMTKDPTATETGGWKYEAYDGNPNVAIKKEMDVVTGCYNCHTAMKHKDYIFSSTSTG